MCYREYEPNPFLFFLIIYLFVYLSGQTTLRFRLVSLILLTFCQFLFWDVTSELFFFSPPLSSISHLCIFPFLFDFNLDLFHVNCHPYIPLPPVPLLILPLWLSASLSSTYVFALAQLSAACSSCTHTDTHICVHAHDSVEESSR